MRPRSSSVTAPACVLALLLCFASAGMNVPGRELSDTMNLRTPAAERIEFLRAELARHDELYYRLARPEISDADYDALKAELAALEQRFPTESMRPSSVASCVPGDDRLPGFAKYRHRERMLSLDKTTTEAGLRDFDQRLRRLLGNGVAVAYVVEPKFDGLAISATYENGRLVRVVTRGDGDEGDDVTAAARRIVALPTTLNAAPDRAWPRMIEVRGEAFMSFAEFERINAVRAEAGEAEFSSPRNLAAGTLKSLDLPAGEQRQLEVVFFGIGAVDADARPASQRELLAWMDDWGLPTVENPVFAASLAEAWRAVQQLGRERARLPYPIDGAVLKLDVMAAQEIAGNGPAAPRWAIAFKYGPERAATRLRAITLQVGRTGAITPVAELEPVALAGAVVRRATLHNAAEIARRDIRVGDWVFLERSGEIIPRVTGVDLARRPAEIAPFVFPETCPACTTRLQRDAGEVAWRCPYRHCAAQVQRRIRHFASNDGVAISGLGESTIETLVTSGAVKRISDLYRLGAPDLERHTRMGAKSAAALVDAIEHSKRAELWRVISGIGFPGVGRTGAQALARRFETLEALLAAGEGELREIDGFGADSTRRLAAFLADPETQALIADLTAVGVRPVRESALAGPLAGKRFVFSGTLPTLTRVQAEECVEDAGGWVSATLTRRTDYLVAGGDAGAKLDRAKRLQVKVITEAQLLAMIADSNGS